MIIIIINFEKDTFCCPKSSHLRGIILYSLFYCCHTAVDFLVSLLQLREDRSLVPMNADGTLEIANADLVEVWKVGYSFKYIINELYV